MRVPEVSENARLIREVFGTRFQLVGGWDVGEGPQLKKILSGIRSSAAVVVEATYLRSNIMLEVGIAYALARRVFFIFNKQIHGKSIRDLPEFIRTLDIIDYGFEPDLLRLARDKIFERLQAEPEPDEVMLANLRGSSLKPSSDPYGVFLWHPGGQAAMWQGIEDDLRSRLEGAQLRLLTTRVAPFGSSLLEEVLYAIRRASTRLRCSCFIDTTGETSADLVGSFGLGASLALGRGATQLVQSRQHNANDLSLWTEPTFTWAERDELIRHLTSAAVARPRKRKT